MLCGVNNTYRNETIDLTRKPNLYYLNALDLLNPINMLYAKSVCVESCPTVEDLCSLESLPCTDDKQYK
jgi:choline transporter-like protein 2/4/5